MFEEGDQAALKAAGHSWTVRAGGEVKREKTKTGITGEFCGEKAYGQKPSGFDESVYLTFKIELTEMLIHDKAAKMAGL